jgi:myo-inositol-1-phosphate synthase
MTLSSLRASCDPNTISMLSFTCSNVKYDVIKKNINMTMNGGQIHSTTVHFFTTVDDSKTILVIFSSMDILCHAQLHFIVELQIIDISLYDLPV